MVTIEQIQDKEWKDFTQEERNFQRGLWGEFEVNRALNEKFSAQRYEDGLAGKHTSFLFDRIHIPAGLGKTTEIDSVFVSQKGVIALEIKSWSGGVIFGERSGKEWFSATAIKHGEINHHKTGNPFGQNDHHVKFLEKLLPYHRNYIKNVVLLINASPFGVKESNWVGDEIEGLFTSIDSLIENITNSPAILSGREVLAVGRALSIHPYGAEFAELKEGGEDEIKESVQNERPSKEENPWLS